MLSENAVEDAPCPLKVWSVECLPCVWTHRDCPLEKDWWFLLEALGFHSHAILRADRSLVQDGQFMVAAIELVIDPLEFLECLRDYRHNCDHVVFSDEDFQGAVMDRMPDTFDLVDYFNSGDSTYSPTWHARVTARHEDLKKK